MEIVSYPTGSKLMNRMASVSGKDEFNTAMVIPATPTGFNVYDLYR
jgi:hypothetical protein